MHPEALCAELETTQRFFRTTIACLRAEDAGFAPRPGMYTVAATVAHVARTVDWFVEGAFARPDGFDMDFEQHIAEAKAVTDLTAALAWCERSFAAAAAAVRTHAGRLGEPLPPGIMEGLPRGGIVGAIVDHTAHHRGSLAVYARLLGREPAIPYG
jgi:uncharacterized damage-inducible protein DinB